MYLGKYMTHLSDQQILSSMLSSLLLSTHDELLLLLDQTGVYQFRQMRTGVTTFCQHARFTTS